MSAHASIINNFGCQQTWKAEVKVRVLLPHQKNPKCLRLRRIWRSSDAVFINRAFHNGDRDTNSAQRWSILRDTIHIRCNSCKLRKAGRSVMSNAGGVATVSAALGKCCWCPGCHVLLLYALWSWLSPVVVFGFISSSHSQFKWVQVCVELLVTNYITYTLNIVCVFQNQLVGKYAICSQEMYSVH